MSKIHLIKGDLTSSTSSRVRTLPPDGVLEKHANPKRVGGLCHKCHVSWVTLRILEGCLHLDLLNDTRDTWHSWPHPEKNIFAFLFENAMTVPNLCNVNLKEKIVCALREHAKRVSFKTYEQYLGTKLVKTERKAKFYCRKCFRLSKTICI